MEPATILYVFIIAVVEVGDNKLPRMAMVISSGEVGFPLISSCRAARFLGLENLLQKMESL